MEGTLATKKTDSKPLTKMENNPKIVAEQQDGRDFYHKLRVDFKEELQQGKVIGLDLTSLPEETLTNFKTGIAHEALKERDYKTATAFFTQLGQNYSDLKNYAEKLWLEDRSKEEEQSQKTLVEKIESLKKPKIKFGYAQERIKEIAKRQDLVKKVMEGETTITQTVQQYQKELEDMKKLKKGKFEEKIFEYLTRVGELGNTLQEFSPLKLPSEENLKIRGRKINLETVGNGIFATSPLSASIAILGLTSLGVAAPIAILAAGVCIASQIVGGSVLEFKGMNLNEYKHKTRETFQKLAGSAEKVDELVHKAFITDFYLKDSEVFKNTFQNLSEEEQRYVLSQLLKKKGANCEVDPWLSETYPKLIEEEGWFNIATG